MSGAHDLGDVLHRESVLILDNKRHPDAASHGFGGARLLEGLNHNRVGRVGVEDLLARDLGGDISKHGRELVAQAAHVADKLHGGGGHALPDTTLGLAEHGLDAVGDDVVLVGKLGAVHGEQGPRGLVHQAQEVDLALGIVDAVRKGALMVADADELHQELLGQEDGGGEEKRQQNAADGLGPLAVGSVEHELEGQP